MTRGHGFTATHLLLRLLLILTAVALPAYANTIHVPADQPTIQAGINAASAGDTVLVAPGTYQENISFNGKAITVTSSGGAAATIIDGGNKPGIATVLLNSGETSASVFSHFTVRGGGDVIFNDPAGDGGIYVSGSSPIIENNIVTANYCHNIDVEFAVATIRNNEVSGVLQSTSSQYVSYCTFGSGIHLQGTPGLNGLGSTIVGNTIENNLTGSGINLWAAQNVLIMNNIIRNNTSGDPGSAFTSANSENTVIVQNLIYGNRSQCGGALGFENGGLSASAPNILIANNTIVDNVTVGPGAGSECIAIAQIYPDPYSYGAGGPGEVILNNIVSGSTSYPAVNCSQYGSPNLSDQPTFENNILYNAGGPFFGSYCVDVTSQDSNLALDPQFVNRGGDDYHLRSTSPAIDAGDDTVLQLFQAMTGESFTADFDGKPRVQNASGKGCTIDIGVYEYPGNASECGTQETLTSSAANDTSTAGENVTFTAQLDSSSGTPTGTVQFLDGSNPLATEPVSSSGSSAFSTTSLSVGSHTITANYQPTGSFASTTASLTQVVTGYSTTTKLNCQPGSMAIGSTALFTASVFSTSGTPSGSIAFSDNSTALSTGNLLNGTASFTYTGTSVATHTINATYLPAGAFSGSSATCSVVVSALPTTSSLSVTPLTANAGSPVTLTATIASQTSSGATTSLPTGTVTFSNGGTQIGGATLASGLATLTVSNLPGGSDSLSCQYSGDSVYFGSSCNTVAVTINALPTILTLSALPNPALAFQPITLTAHLSAAGASSFPNGLIAFVANGSALGTASLGGTGVSTLVVNLPAGTETLTASFAGTSTLNGSTSNPITEVVTPDTTTTNLAVAPNPAAQNTAVTLTAQVTPSSSQTVPTGSINFFDGTASLGDVPLAANGTASFTSSTFSLGTHTLTALFSGSGNDQASISAPQSLVVNAQNMVLTAPASLTIKTGHHAEMNFTLTSVGGFSDTVDLTCLNLPQWATCRIETPHPVLGPNQTLALAVYVDTDAVLGYESELRSPGVYRDGIAVALLLPLGLLAKRSKRRSPGRFTLLLLIGFAASLLPLTGCSGLYPASVTPGNYTIAVAGHGEQTGQSRTATFTLIVTP